MSTNKIILINANISLRCRRKKNAEGMKCAVGRESITHPFNCTPLRMMA